MAEENIDYGSVMQSLAGKTVRVYPQGLAPFEGVITKGAGVLYSADGGTTHLILIPGHPAKIETDEGTIDLRRLRP